MLSLLLPCHALQAQSVLTTGTTVTTKVPTTISTRNNNNNNRTGNAPATSQSETDTTAGMPKGIDFNHHEEADSVLRRQVFHFHVEPTKVRIYHIDNPSLDPTEAEFVDPIDRVVGPFYLSRGSIGQQHISLSKVPQGSASFSFRPELFEALVKDHRNINFYQVQRPFTSLAYGSSLNKEYRVGVTHSQNVAQRWNVAFNYNLVSLDGVYTNGNVDNHQFDINTNYYSADSRYQLWAAVIRQQFTTAENGGIADDASFLLNQQTNRAGMVVNLYNAYSRQRTFEAFVRQSYNFVRQVPMPRQRDSVFVAAEQHGDSVKLDTVTVYDTVWPGTPSIFNPGVISCDISYLRSKRNYSDRNIAGNTFYPVFYYDGVETYDSAVAHTVEASLFWTNDAYPQYRFRTPLTLAVGMKPQVARLAMQDDRYTFASLSPFASLGLALAGNASLKVNATTTIADNYLAGNTRVDAALDIAATLFKRRFDVSVDAVHNVAAADYIYYHYDANNYRWDNDLRKIATSWLLCRVADTAGFALSLTASRIGNAVHFLPDMSVQQIANTGYLMQAELQWRLSWGWFHYDMHHLLQHSSDRQVVEVPLFATKNSFYADMHLFKKALHAQTGVDVRYHTAYHAMAYNPVVGAFYRQQDVTVGNYLWADAFVSLQVKRATIYLKVSHFNAPLEAEPSYMLLPHYPGQDLAVYWGLVWKFFD